MPVGLGDAVGREQGIRPLVCVFEIRDWKIVRCFIYLDPDYAGKDPERYSWLNK